jgi:nitrogenase molybdenum-iron protein alpha/beta subunit
LNDFLLHTNIYEVKETHAVFGATVKINGEICQLLFTYFKPTQTITVEGYVIEDDLTSRIHDLTEGMEITVIYEDPIPEDGQLYYEEGKLIWGEDVEFSIKKVDVGYYQYIPYIIDIYGNVYYGQTAIVYFDGEKSIMQNIAAG